MDAKAVIEKFGGQSALARLIGKGQSTVAYWAKSGVIPAKWHQQLLDLAKSNGVRLTELDMPLVGAAQQHTSMSPVSGSGRQEPPARALVPDHQSDGSPFLFYASDDGTIKVQVVVGEETVWASQRGMGEIFDVDVGTISEHLQNIFRTFELDELSVVRNFRTTDSDGKNYDMNFYSLDAIISVGYQVSSYQATQFRQYRKNTPCWLR